MTTSITEASNYLNTLLEISSFEDCSLNGLQVEANHELGCIGASVDFSLSTAKTALNKGVNTILCHHGMLWGKEAPVTGRLAETLKFLFASNINLLAVHLPLDAHELYGNNAIIARDLLNLSETQPALNFAGKKLGSRGFNHNRFSISQITDLFRDIPGALKDPLCLPFGPEIPERICILSGAGADALYRYKEENFDTFITGEPRQFAYHFCKEHKLNAIFAGHYATETFGVRKLAEHLAEKYSTSWVFIDEPTGI